MNDMTTLLTSTTIIFNVKGWEKFRAIDKYLLNVGLGKDEEDGEGRGK